MLRHWAPGGSLLSRLRARSVVGLVISRHGFLGNTSSSSGRRRRVSRLGAASAAARGDPDRGPAVLGGVADHRPLAHPRGAALADALHAGRAGPPERDRPADPGLRAYPVRWDSPSPTAGQRRRGRAGKAWCGLGWGLHEGPGRGAEGHAGQAWNVAGWLPLKHIGSLTRQARERWAQNGGGLATSA